jgi:hypothetical protein
MSRESEWIQTIVQGDFPDDVEFLEGSLPNHVIVEWQVVGSDDAPRRNAPFVVVIDPEAIERYEKSNHSEQSRIAARVCEILDHRREHYDPNGSVDVAEAFVVLIDEGDL